MSNNFILFLKQLFSDRKKTVIICIIAVICLFLIIGTVYLFTNINNESPKYSADTKIVDNTHNEKDLDGLITGIDDQYIVQNSENIDYLANVIVDKQIIRYVDVDANEVNLSVPGTYTITYKVTINSRELAEHLGEKYSGSDDDIEIIEIQKEITVVTQEDAQKLADQGEIVIGSNNETVPKSDGTVTPTPEPEVGIDNATQATPTPEAEKTSGSGTATKPSSNSGSSSSNSNKNSGSSGSSSENTSSGSDSSGSTSSGNSGSSSSGGNTSTHTHSWEAVTTTVHHDATGHYETKVITAAYDEPVYENRTICSCGEDITEKVASHYVDCEGSYSNKKVQTGSIHHDAVTEQVWVQDSAAYDETVVTGYKCSCGATK